MARMRTSVGDAASLEWFAEVLRVDTGLMASSFYY